MAQRVVIVDDEQSFAEIGELILSRAGYEVTRFERPVEALASLPALAADLVLSDVEMPEMDGFDFLRAIRRDPRFEKLPFIFMSARRTYPPDRVQGLELGSDDYISKPFSGEELISRVKAVLRRTGRAEAAAPPSTTGLAPQGDALESMLRDLPPPAAAAPTVPGAVLPDPLPVFGELRRRLAEGRPTAVVLADLSYFRGYNECYGYDQGDQVLLFTRQCLEGAARRAGEANGVTHLHADGFLVLTDPARALPLAQAALAAFAGGVQAFYSEPDQVRGFIEGKNRQGRTLAYPFLNLVLAVASNSLRRVTHPGHFIHVGRELLAYAKTLGGSRYVEDRRRDPPSK